MHFVSIGNHRVLALPTEQIMSSEGRQSEWREEGLVLELRGPLTRDDAVPSGIVMRTSWEGQIRVAIAHIH